MARFAFRESLSHTNVQGNMTSTDGLLGSVVYCMKMYVINLEDWKFGGDWSRNEIWTKNSLSGHGDFSSKFRQKNHRFHDLEEIWRQYERSKYLVI